MKKGQITIEYLIVLVIMILLFSSVSMDLIDHSITNTMQIQTSEIVRQTESNLLGAANALTLQGTGSKTTVKIRAPSDCDFYVNFNYLEILCGETTSSYNEFNAVQFATAPSGISYSCLTCDGGLITNEELEVVQISK